MFAYAAVKKIVAQALLKPNEWILMCRMRRRGGLVVSALVSSLKSVLKKLRFRDGLVWTAGLTEEIKLRFQISPK